MNIFGKILTWGVVLAACAAVVLTSKVVTYRNSWAKRIEELQKKNEDKAKSIAEKRRVLRERRGELSRVMLGWDRYWDGINTGVSVEKVADGPDEVDVAGQNIGTNFGLGLVAGKEPPVVHLFMPDGKDGSIYVGAFQPPNPVALEENRVALKPTWRIHGGEAESWKPGNWRWRMRIPSSFEGRFGQLYADLALADELLATKRRNLVLQNKLYQVSELHRDYRLQELLGPPDPPKLGPNDKIDHYLIGLVKAIELEEERRNAAQAEVDRLRREMEQKKKQLRELIDKNRELAEKLAQSKPAQTVDATNN